MGYILVIIATIIVWEYLKKTRLGEQFTDNINKYLGRKRCFSCHLYIRKNDKFCGHCGSKL